MAHAAEAKKLNAQGWESNSARREHGLARQNKTDGFNTSILNYAEYAKKVVMDLDADQSKPKFNANGANESTVSDKQGGDDSRDAGNNMHGLGVQAENMKDMNTVQDNAKPSFAAVLNKSVSGDKKAVNLRNVQNELAQIVTTELMKKKINFRKVESVASPAGEFDVMIPLASVKEVNDRLQNSLYGYFLGKRVAFPVVESYVFNAWAKFGVQKVMMNSSGFYFFKFATQKNVEDVLESGPWMIRNVPIILDKWNPEANLTKVSSTFEV